MTDQNKTPVITLIGAGSRVFSFNMCTDICQTPVLKGAEIRLVDVDTERLDSMKKLFELVSQKTGMDLKISSYTDRAAALPGTDYIIISVAFERIDRWDKDLEISRNYGIIESQGECGGPGGLSLTLRNIPLILEIAKDIEKLSPNSLVLNFSNPMTRVCTALNRYTKLRSVGLCHGLLGVQRMLSKLAGRPLIVKGCGINHFNWVFAAKWADDGQDAWPNITKTFMDASKDDIGDWIYIRELFEIFGRICAPDDEHIADFIHHWRGNKGGLKERYRMAPKDMKTYRKAAAQWEQKINSYLSGEKNPMDNVNGLSGEGAIPIISAMAGLIPPYDEISVNIPNKGYINNLPMGAVVEVPAHISAGHIKGENIGNLPAGIHSLISRQLEIADLAVEAAVEGDYNKALQALAIDPLITDLQMAKDYLADILDANGDILTRFK